jgi:Mg-chelatase subunit ChlD
MRTSRLACLVAALICACGNNSSSRTSSGEDPNANAGNASGDGDTHAAPVGGDEGDGDTAKIDAGANVCEQLETAARPVIPEVLVVLDRSGSMFGERWTQVTLAIDKLIAAFPNYRFGLSMYPAVGEELDCKAGKLDVKPEDMTSKAIHDVLFAPEAVAIQDHGYTPTASTLRAAKAYFDMPVLDDVHDRYVLLITDGQPNCNAAGPTLATADVDATLQALTELAKEKVPSFVFGYRTEDFATVMNQLAVAGGTEHHYAVEDDAQILAAFDQIDNSIVSCSFALEHDAPGAEFVRVLLDGKELTYGANGFTMPNARTVALSDKTCATLKDGGVHGVKVLVECEPVRVL